jgi:predicted Zn-ribbon and HTH transcriptional regulator
VATVQVATQGKKEKMMNSNPDCNDNSPFEKGGCDGKGTHLHIDWERMTIVAGYQTLKDANSVKDRLEKLGVESIVLDTNAVLKSNKKSLQNGEVQLIVNDIDKYKAKVIIDDEFDDDIDKKDTFIESRCPKCKSSDIVYEKTPVRHTILNILLLGLPGLFMHKTWICLRCEHEWKEFN